MNINYIKQGDYLIPDLKLKDNKEYNIGKYGLLKLDYIKKYKKGFYTELLIKGDLNKYLHDIDITVNERINNLISLLTEKENINETLKKDNHMLWVSKMNSIKNIAEEIVLDDLIYEKL